MPFNFLTTEADRGVPILRQFREFSLVEEEEEEKEEGILFKFFVLSAFLISLRLHDDSQRQSKLLSRKSRVKCHR